MLASILGALVSGLLKPLLDTFMLNRQINARISEKTRADTAENAGRGETAAVQNEAEIRQARENAKKLDTGLDSW